jgi:hypothetical protein
MTEAYAVAAVRHWDDARLLETSIRRPNADHLYGVAAECGLKSALVAVGAATANPTLPDRYYQHIDKLWTLIPHQNIQKRFPGLAALLKGPGTPFGDWSIDQRYADGTAVTTEVLERHRTWASRVLGAVGLNGVRQGGAR